MKKILLILLVTSGLFAEYARENDTLIESHLHLQWQDTSPEKRIWKDAIDFCENSSFAGYEDWRLPNINELKTIIDRRKKGIAIVEDFKNLDALDTVSLKHWSSTTYIHSKTKAHSINFAHGTIAVSVKHTAENYVRCVRDF